MQLNKFKIKRFILFQNEMLKWWITEGGRDMKKWITARLVIHFPPIGTAIIFVIQNGEPLSTNQMGHNGSTFC